MGVTTSSAGRLRSFGQTHHARAPSTSIICPITSTVVSALRSDALSDVALVRGEEESSDFAEGAGEHMSELKGPWRQPVVCYPKQARSGLKVLRRMRPGEVSIPPMRR